MRPSPKPATRPLAEVETDLLAAEKAFEDAVKRMNDAKRDLETALDRINQHQAELDEAVAALRERSPAGSRWKAISKDELQLGSDQVASEVGEPLSANIQTLSEQFERLRAITRDSSGAVTSEHGQSFRTGAG